MSGRFHLATAVAIVAATAIAQNPAADLPYRRAELIPGHGGAGIAITATDPEAAAFFGQGLALLHAGWSWEAQRSFREVVHREPDSAVGRLGLALGARAYPRRAAGFAWKAYSKRDRASDLERRIVDCYAHYFRATERPDLADPSVDVAPPIERHAALVADLGRIDGDGALLRALVALESGAGEQSPERDLDATRTALHGHLGYLVRERAMPFTVPGYADDLERLRGEGASDPLPRHPHFDAIPATQTPPPFELDAAGPSAWQPFTAPGYDVPRGLGGRRTLAEHDGEPVLVVFFLGFGCIHCVEQLHALAPFLGAFEEAGIDIVTIGTDTPQEVKASYQMVDENGDERLPFDVLCDPGGASFRAWSAWDEFKDEALHGTFLVDPKGRILWQDISVEPFMDTAFLLAECQRLLESWR